VNTEILPYEESIFSQIKLVTEKTEVTDRLLNCLPNFFDPPTIDGWIY